MRSIWEMARDRQRAIERESRIRELSEQWEIGDYITAADAAQEIGMSPMRFLALLRKERDRLPIEANALAIELAGAFILGTIEQVFYDKGINVNLNFIKIHRLDWEAYLSSEAASGPNEADPAGGGDKDPFAGLPPIKSQPRISSVGAGSIQMSHTRKENPIVAQYFEAGLNAGWDGIDIAEKLIADGVPRSIAACFVFEDSASAEAADLRLKRQMRK